MAAINDLSDISAVEKEEATDLLINEQGKEIREDSKKNTNAHRENIRRESKVLTDDDDIKVRVSLQPCKVNDNLKVHITPLTKFRPETPYGVKTLHAKYFQNQNCVVFP